MFPLSSKPHLIALDDILAVSVSSPPLLVKLFSQRALLVKELLSKNACR